MTFAEEIRLGIPDYLPEMLPYDNNINHAPKRKEILTAEERQLALKNSTSTDVSICIAIVLIMICMHDPLTSIRIAQSKLPASCL